MFKSITSQFAPELNPDCVYYLDCLRPPVVCAECKLKNDTFIDMSVERALQEQSKAILNGALKSDFYLRVKECTTAATEYVLPMTIHKVIRQAVIGIRKRVMEGEGVVS
jgi:hypothetical protein